MNNLGASNYESARTRLRNILIASLLAAALSVLIPGSYGALRLALTMATILLFISAIVVIVRDCRCPHCGSVIFFGALRASTCPRCKRSLTTGKKQKKSKK